MKEREFREQLQRAAEGVRASDDAFEKLLHKNRRGPLRLAPARRTALVLVAATVAALGVGVGVRATVCSDFHGPTALAGDGRYVAYIAKQGCGSSPQAFVHDRVTKATTRVSRTPTGGGANGPAYDVALSADGRHVAFSSSASNLVPSGTDGLRQVFVRDLDTHTTVLASVTSTGQAGNGASLAPVLSVDGRYVAFQSRATNLATADTNGGSDIFLHDMQTGRTTLVSVSMSGTPGNSFSLRPSISDDGHRIAFVSNASDLVPGDVNGAQDVFVRDTTAHTTTLVSTGSDVDNFVSDISPDGMFVVYASRPHTSSSPATASSANAAYLVDLRDGSRRSLGRFTSIDSVVASSGAGVIAVSSREKTGIITVLSASKTLRFARTGFEISITNDGRYISFTGGLNPVDAQGILDWARSALGVAVPKW